MRIYTLYFSFFGRNMKTDITASSEEEAKRQLEKKIIYLKPTTSKAVPTASNPIMDFMNGFLNKK